MRVCARGMVPTNFRLFTDSFKNKIFAYDYSGSGEAVRKRDFVSDALSQGLPEGTYPDGLCIDKDGGVWSARFVLLQRFCTRCPPTDYRSRTPRPCIVILMVATGRAPMRFCRSWGGSRIIRYTKDGEMDLEVVFPTALHVTACTFGGK